MMATQSSNQLSGTAVPQSFGSPAYGHPAHTYPTQPTPTPTPEPDNPGPKRKLTHKCPWKNCPRWLSCPHNVAQHIRESHTGEKPYACDRCPQAFTRPWGLYRHLRAKHGVEQAGPGRGRGGGLARLGVEKPLKRREERRGRGRKKGRRGVEQAVQGAGSGVGGGGMQQQLLLPLPSTPQQASEAETAAFGIDNFAPVPTACQQCGARFENREALLAHLHNEHGEPSSQHCDCMLCLCTFGGPVDAAGVHVREAGAVRMRGLMAHDLFGGDEGGLASEHAFAVKTGKDVGVKEILAGMGMTEEQFTANMHMDVDPPRAETTLLPSGLDAVAEARFTANMPQPKAMAAVSFYPLTPEAEARFTANMPSVSTSTPDMGFGGMTQGAGMDVDELMGGGADDMAFEAWLKSAEEVFGDV